MLKYTAAQMQICSVMPKTLLAVRLAHQTETKGDIGDQ